METLRSLRQRRMAAFGGKRGRRGRGGRRAGRRRGANRPRFQAEEDELNEVEDDDDDDDEVEVEAEPEREFRMKCGTCQLRWGDRQRGEVVVEEAEDNTTV